jgi:hypothetical protein
LRLASTLAVIGWQPKWSRILWTKVIFGCNISHFECIAQGNIPNWGVVQDQIMVFFLNRDYF